MSNTGNPESPPSTLSQEERLQVVWRLLEICFTFKGDLPQTLQLLASGPSSSIMVTLNVHQNLQNLLTVCAEHLNFTLTSIPSEQMEQYLSDFQAAVMESSLVSRNHLQ